MRALRLLPAVLVLAGCPAAEQPPVVATDMSCFNNRVLSFQDLVAEVVIPSGESCSGGTFQVVFTRGGDTLETLTEPRNGTVGFIGTADVDGDGRGEFFVSTIGIEGSSRGSLFAYSETTQGIARFAMAPLDSAQMKDYAGHDRFGFGGGDQLVRAFPRTGADTAWFGYSHGEKTWKTIARPAWVR